jgi:gamma-glutamylcyclotransferase (GGCT)/AIG2-like uncharacterized protein YtfP
VEEYLFVYGTLKRNERLHDLLRSQEFIDTATTVDANFNMGDLGNAYPIVFRSNEDENTFKYKIRGEVFKLTSPGVYHYIDRMEKGAAYKMVDTLVRLSNNKQMIVKMYVMDDLPYNPSYLTKDNIKSKKNILEWSNQ